VTVLLRNNVDSTLATAASSSDLGMTVANGGLFPLPASGEYFYATVTDPAGLFEIVKVTARTGNTLTVVRAQEGTGPVAFAAGSRIELRVTAQTIADAISDSELDIAAYFAAGGNGTSVGLNVGAGKTLNVDGTLDASGGVALLPQANNPDQITEGSVVWDSSDDVLTVGTGSGRKTMVDTDSVQTVRNKTLDGATVTGSTVNNTPVGATTPASGSFTTLNASGALNFLPVGSIIMWSPPAGVTTAPIGWAICDGTTPGVPDLRGRFVVGAGGTYALDDTGGSADAAVISHTHTATIANGGEHSHESFPFGQPGAGTNFADRTLASVNGLVPLSTNGRGIHSHSATVAAPVGSVSGTNRNLPPYYALYFIMRVI
jgi:microcystin-dependent protein